MKRKNNTKPNTFEAALESTSMQGLSDADKAILIESFEAAVKSKSDQAVELALRNQDQQFSKDTRELLETIDDAYFAKAEKMIAVKERKYLDVVNKLNKRHEKELVSEAKQFQKKLVSKLSTFISAKVDKAIPTEMINEAVSNTKATIVLEGLRGHLAVDSALEKKSVREGIEDGKNQIKILSESINTLKKDNNRLKTIVDSGKRSEVLNAKLKGADKAKIAHITGVVNNVKDQSYEYLKENIDHIIGMYDQNQDSIKADFVSRARNKRGSEQTNTSIGMLNENKRSRVATSTKSNDPMDLYMGGLSE